MTRSTEEPAKTGRCRWCLERDRHLAEAEARRESGLPYFHPLVTRSVNRARIAGLRADHPITLDPTCPHETEATP